MHWADVIAKEVIDNYDAPLIATGISPTGIIHVGSLREAITGESIRSAIEGMGKDVKLIYLIDSFDPLRKRYPFLPEEFEKYTGMPICRIPCPCGKHDNYAHHFIQPFLDAVKSLNVKCEIIWTHELYEQGRFADTIDKAFKRRERAIQILHEVSGREESPDYAPYTPLCSECGRFTNPIFESYEFPTVKYECKCGHRGVADVTKGDGKLTWRLEWPAKWAIFGTSAEPFGKDHAAAGGSYDTGKRIVEEIFDSKAPYPIPYEFVQLKGLGQMHKSSGSSVSGTDAIMMTPPEVLNYLFLRVNPNKAIDFDSGVGTMDMVEEYDRTERLFFSKEFTDAEENTVRAYEIAQDNNVPKALPMQIPYRHLVNVVQMSEDFDEVLGILNRTEDMSKANKDDIERLRKRVECTRFWLKWFAPEAVRFSVCPSVPSESNISDIERTFFKELVNRMGDCNWDGDTIGNIISETGKGQPIGAKNGYMAIYSIFINKKSGPKLGAFLASMDKQFVMDRFIQASK